MSTLPLIPSASLWGCELKYAWWTIEKSVDNVSLLVRLWVEMKKIVELLQEKRVSLLVRLWVEICCVYNNHPHKVVSLLVRLWVEIKLIELRLLIASRQPPCEAVSWNYWNSTRCFNILPSASLWGCELKYNCSVVNLLLISQPPCEAVSWNVFQWCQHGWVCVSLLVRLWVEITSFTTCNPLYSSASLWGCELKCPYLCSKVGFQRSASLWGCELKCSPYRQG